MFKAVRTECGGMETRRPITTRNAECGTRNRVIRGTEREALEFARRACEYLRPSGVESVEAWSVEIQNDEFKIQNPKSEIEHLVRFCLKPHRNDRDWIAEPNELPHGG